MALSFGPKSNSSGSRTSRRGKAQANNQDSSLGKRKSIRKEGGGGFGSARRRDDAPAGTTNLAVSESAQRKRNHEIDEAVQRRGRRVGDIRASERAERARKRYASYIFKIVAAIAVVLLVVFGSIFIYRSSLFTITKVTVSGVEHLTDQEITQLAAVPDDSTLLRLDAAGICSRLEEHPWVQTATISRKFPSSIELVITERTPAAVVKLNKKSIWVISTDGAWLSAATKSDWKKYRHIVNVDPNMSDPVAGSECTDEGILNALKIYDNVSPKLAKRIKSISAASPVKTSITLKNGVTVAFGEAEDLELKEADIWTLLSKHKGKISYINVRVPDRPTYRTSK